MTQRRLTCRELIDFLAAYVENELPEEERTVFDAHLAVCPHCVDYLASYRATLRLGREAYAPESDAPDEVPPELVDAILAARPRR